MNKDSNEMEAASEKGLRPEPQPEPRPVAPRSEKSAGRPAAAARLSGQRKALIKTADLAMRAGAPRPTETRQVPRVARARGRKASVPAGPARQQKIEERIAAATEQLASGISEAGSAADQLRRAMEQIASGAEQAAGASQQTLVVATNTATTLVQARARADSARRRAETLQGLLTEASNQIGAWATNIKQNGERQAGSVSVMERLSQQAAGIGNVTKAVSHVSDETNLLALNAAIEAAHAGDAGLGFSVVAEEIRKLADRSVEATRDVGKVIKGIQSETAEAINAMENGMTEVRNGLVLAEESRDALQAISAVLKPSTELAEEISVASEEQSRVTMNLARAMQTISSITMQASAGAHETAQIIQGMVGLSDKLNESISQFKVSEGGNRI